MNEPTTNYDLFYANWEPRVRAMALRRGLRHEELDDCVAIIMSEFWAGDYLIKYDPTRAKFTTYIYSQIGVRITGYLSKLWKHGQREIANDELISHVALTVADPSDDLALTEITQALADVYKRLSENPPNRTKNLARLFQDIVEQLNTEGKVNYAEIAKKYGCSRQAISLQVKSLLKAEPVVELKKVLKQ